METIGNVKERPTDGRGSGSIRRECAIIARKGFHAMHCAGQRLTDPSIASDCGEEDTMRRAPQALEFFFDFSFRKPEFMVAYGSSPNGGPASAESQRRERSQEDCCPRESL
jgi:hypothetical protein